MGRIRAFAGTAGLALSAALAAALVAAYPETGHGLPRVELVAKPRSAMAPGWLPPGPKPEPGLALTEPEQPPSRKLFFDSMGAGERSAEQAILLLKQALADDPSFESALERLAGLYLDRGRLEEAENEASTCLSVNARNLHCHKIRVRALLEGGREGAMEALQDCLGSFYERVGDIAGARKNYADACALGSDEACQRRSALADFSG